jgi:hypothetical protein
VQEVALGEIGPVLGEKSHDHGDLVKRPPAGHGAAGMAAPEEGEHLVGDANGAGVESCRRVEQRVTIVTLGGCLVRVTFDEPFARLASRDEQGLEPIERRTPRIAEPDLEARPQRRVVDEHRRRGGVELLDDRLGGRASGMHEQVPKLLLSDIGFRRSIVSTIASSNMSFGGSRRRRDRMQER